MLLKSVRLVWKSAAKSNEKLVLSKICNAVLILDDLSPLVFILLQFLEITFFLKILGAKTPIESTLPRPLLVVTWASWVKVTKFDFQSLLRLFKFNFRYCELRRDYLFSSEVIPITFFLEVSLWYKTSKTFFFPLQMPLALDLLDFFMSSRMLQKNLLENNTYLVTVIWVCRVSNWTNELHFSDCTRSRLDTKKSHCRQTQNFYNRLYIDWSYCFIVWMQKAVIFRLH